MHGVGLLGLQELGDQLHGGQEEDLVGMVEDLPAFFSKHGLSENFGCVKIGAGRNHFVSVQVVRA